MNEAANITGGAGHDTIRLDLMSADNQAQGGKGGQQMSAETQEFLQQLVDQLVKALQGGEEGAEETGKSEGAASHEGGAKEAGGGVEMNKLLEMLIALISQIIGQEGGGQAKEGGDMSGLLGTAGAVAGGVAGTAVGGPIGGALGAQAGGILGGEAANIIG